MSSTTVSQAFHELRGKGKRAYIPYLCCGDGGREFTVELAHALVNSGADALELGIPFSDTLADGQTIQEASERALRAGMNVEQSFSVLGQLRTQGIDVPILPMTYYNLIHHYGVERFCGRMAREGGNGLLIPDVPFEESGRLRKACADNELDLIYFVAPTTTEERMKKILSVASGFMYAVAVTGVTGARDSFEEEARSLIRTVKGMSRIPVAVGFGISKPEQAHAAALAGADAIVEGSQLIKLYSPFLKVGGFPHARRGEALEAVRSHVREMKHALEQS